MKSSTKILNTRMISFVGILGALACVIMLFDFPIPFLAPPFYKLDFSEVIVLIGGFALGPVASVFIEFLKIVLYMFFKPSSTAYVGELANFIIGISFVLPAVIIYHRNKSMKHAVIGMIVGTLAMCLTGALLNYFVLIPLYVNLWGIPLEEILKAGSVINGSVSDLNSFVILMTTPFNLFKGIISSLITLLLYKKVSVVIKKS